MADYYEAVERGYQMHGTRDGALKFAQQFVEQNYGLMDNRIVKYPGTKAYPALNGSHGWMFEQAAIDVNAQRKARDLPEDVKPADIIFEQMPDGSTATVYGQRNRPVPYMLLYKTRGPDGQEILDVALGSKGQPLAWYGALPNIPEEAEGIRRLKNAAEFRALDEQALERPTNSLEPQPLPNKAAIARTPKSSTILQQAPQMPLEPPTFRKPGENAF